VSILNTEFRREAMPLPQVLTESNWKANGLPKRTVMEKLKDKKTYISDALRDYAAFQSDAPLQRLRDRQFALKWIKKKVNDCRQKSNGNRKLLDHLQTMDRAVADEVSRINTAIESVTLENILQDSAKTIAFLHHCKAELNAEQLEFLLRLKRREDKATLFRDFVPAGSPKQLNIPHAIREKVIEALNVDINNSTAWEICRHEIINVLGRDPLRRFKTKLKIKVD
jgi:hypothetical protein